MVAKPRPEDDPLHIKMMEDMKADYEECLNAAIVCLRDSDFDSLLALRETIVNMIEGAEKDGRIILELLAKFSHLGMIHARLEQDKEDKFNKTTKHP